MDILLYAQPYDISAEGFYFRSAEEYDKKSKEARNSYGDPVEEFEIQFIEGGLIDCELAKAIDISQANFSEYLDCIDDWENHEKITVIIAVGECGYRFDTNTRPVISTSIFIMLVPCASWPSSLSMKGCLVKFPKT